jgi:cephalosporin hydroxylase
MTPEEFEKRNRETIARMVADADLRELSQAFLEAAMRYEYSHHFTWLGLPVIQLPQDIVALQELIWRVKPDAIVETGVARGGSLVFYASMLALLGSPGRVVGVDSEIRAHNRKTIEDHPLGHRIVLIEASSADGSTALRVRDLLEGASRVLVVLDSNHTHDHVKKELALFSPLVRKGGYLVVLDTIVERLSDAVIGERPWGRGNSPGTAVVEFLAANPRFAIDSDLQEKLLISVAPGGFLRCVSD